MGRAERPLLLILGALFLAMAGWMGLSAWETLSDPIHTTLAVPMTVEETVEEPTETVVEETAAEVVEEETAQQDADLSSVVNEP